MADFPLIKKKFNVINIDKISYSSNFYNVKNFKKDKKYSFVNVPLHDIYEEEASILMIDKDPLVISEDNQEILKCI